MGFATGPKILIDAINGHVSDLFRGYFTIAEHDDQTAVQSLQTSTLTQILAYSILKSWGYDGFQKHCNGVAQLYRQKRDTFELALAMHLTGLAVWVKPEAGMFFW